MAACGSSEGSAQDTPVAANADTDVSTVQTESVVETAVSAQEPNPPADFTPLGMNQGRQGVGGGLGLMAVDTVDMHAAIAEAVGLSVAEFEAALAIPSFSS